MFKHFLSYYVVGALIICSLFGIGNVMSDEEPFEKIYKTDEEWKKILSDEVYYITRKAGTEARFSGKYDKFYEPGLYVCSNCQHKLFSSEHKYDSKSGWPSFWQPYNDLSIATREDRHLFFQVRTEVLCNRCGAHLGHVFDDGPEPTGLRYCINSLALEFIPNKE